MPRNGVGSIRKKTMDKRTPEQFLAEEEIPIEERMYLNFLTLIHENPHLFGDRDQRCDLCEKDK